MEPKTYNIKVHSIDIIEKQLFRLKAIPQDGEIYTFQVKAQSNVEFNSNVAVIFVSVDINTSKSERQKVANMFVAFGYLVEDLKEKVLIKNEENVYSFPKELEDLLKTISLSTLRGIMYSEFRGTIIHKAILPIIFANTLVAIEGDLVP